MGFDTQRFPNGVDEELICAICGGVLQNPLQIPSCEHTFCQKCIEEWLLQAQICPIDRTPVEMNHLKFVPRILKNLLNRLDITCENEGCAIVVKLDHLANHLTDCQYSQKKLIQCENGCGIIVSSEDLQAHNCIEVLNKELDSMKNELQKYRNDIEFYKTEISALQEFIRRIRVHCPVASAPFQPFENDEIQRWSSNLQVARVTHWGGMISTPNIDLQNSIKRALLNSECPISVTNDLMENVHERHWPEGISALETRQVNHRYYESYVCRRIIGEQAVVILGCDNRHMNESMICEPGMVIIFSHGVK